MRAYRIREIADFAADTLLVVFGGLPGAKESGGGSGN